MSKFDDMVDGLQQELEVPEQVWKKYTDTLSELTEKERVSSVKNK